MRSEERAGLPRVRVAVLGSSRVGKSALIVRYLTRRFIGEYHSNTDLLYRQTVPINGTPVELEVIDVSGSNPDNFPAEQVQWADACLLVYSVTDRKSFEYAAELLTALRRTNTTTAVTNTNANNGQMPLALIGNKTDLDHLRQVPTAEGQSVSAAAGASFSEASVADNTGELYRCMDRLLGECRAVAARVRKFSVSKMFGNFSFGSQTPPVTARSGSVVVCPRVPVSRPPIAAAAP